MEQVRGFRGASRSIRLALCAGLGIGALVVLATGPAAAGGVALTESRTGTRIVVAVDEPPDVVGLPLAVARQRLAQEWYPDRAGSFELVVEVQPDQPGQVSPDGVLVVAQDVTRYLEDSDDVQPRASIVLTVGSAVPDLLGLSGTEAEELLDLLGLGTKVSGEGAVVRQSAPAGSLLPFGSVVAVRLQPAPSQDRLVPALSGLTRAQAQAAVEQVDLVLAVEAESGAGERTVRDQDPLPGTSLPIGGRVGVTLVGDGTTISTVLVPDVTGLAPDAARRVLDAAGLALTADPPDAGADSLALRQDPLAGDRVAPGAPVRVTFAVVLQGEPTSWVPWLGGGAAVVLVVALALLAALRGGGPGPHGQTTTTAAELTVQPRADPDPRVTTHTTGTGPDVALQVVATPDAGTLVLEEERR